MFAQRKRRSTRAREELIMILDWNQYEVSEIFKHGSRIDTRGGGGKKVTHGSEPGAQSFAI